MNLKVWMERLAPDFFATGRRFPVAILLLLLMTLIVIGAINEVAWLQGKEWIRAAAGLGTGAIVAVAGVYFAESNAGARGWAWVLAYALPIAVVALFQVTGTWWFVPYALPVVAVMWLSVSAVTKAGSGDERKEQQTRFWLGNEKALSTAAIAAAAFAILALGMLAIERSLSQLFGLELNRLFYEFLLPITGLFLTPVYWLSTLPRLNDLRAEEAREPDFVGRAMGFLGQFVLVPMLFLYALILLAYTIQIVVTQSMPEGLIGWMVLGFVVVGAAAWLVLYPPFMRDKPLVRLYRRVWFWLTLVPLALFFVAVWVRVDAYGLTAERMLLVAGGLWGVVLAVIFLSGRGDIRLVPTLAGAMLLALSVGPWNFVNLPIQHQLLRLDTLVFDAGADRSQSPPRTDWSAAEVAEARSAIDYLAQFEDGRSGTRQLMAKYGVTWPEDRNGSYVVLAALGVPDTQFDHVLRYVTLTRRADSLPVDVSATPLLMGPVVMYGDANTVLGPVRFEALGGKLLAGSTAAGANIEIPLAAWLSSQEAESLINPRLAFSVDGTSYLLLVNSVSIDKGEDGVGPPVFSGMDALLFAAPATPNP